MRLKITNKKLRLLTDRYIMKWMKRFALAAVAVGCMMIMNPQEVKADVTWIQLQDYINNPKIPGDPDDPDDPGIPGKSLNLENSLNNSDNRDLPAKGETLYYEQFGNTKGVTEEKKLTELLIVGQSLRLMMKLVPIP